MYYTMFLDTKKERRVSLKIEDKVIFWDFPKVIVENLPVRPLRVTYLFFFLIILQLMMLSEPDDSYRLDQYIG